MIGNNAMHPAGRAAVHVVGTLVLAAAFAASRPFSILSASVDEALMRATQSRAAPQGVVVVDFDDASIQAMRSQLGPWPYGRDVHAALVDFLREAGARKIVFDIVFADPRDGDAELARRLAGHDDVVLAAATVGSGGSRPGASLAEVERLSQPGQPGEPAMPWPDVELPAPTLSAALAVPGSIGIVTTPLDDDGQLRWLPLLHVTGGRTWPSLALAALIEPGTSWNVGDRQGVHELGVGSHRWAIDQRGRIRFSFAETAAHLPTLTARAVLDAALGRSDSGSLREAVRGRTVFVGSSAFLSDRVMTPSGQLQGVAVFAAEYDALSRDDLVRDAPGAVSWVLSGFALVPLLLAVRRAKPTPRKDAAVSGAVALTVVGIALTALAAGRVLVSPGFPLTILGLGFALDALTQWGRSVKANLRLAEERRVADAANAAKSDFLACMSHELRTPLHAILGMADALAQTSLDPTQRHRVEVLRQSGTALAGLIDDLLDFSRIEANRLTLHAESFSLRELLEAQRALFEVRARDKGLSLTLQIATEAGTTVHGDAKRFAQVIVNLVGNAIKFTENGSVSITVDRLPDGLLHVAVRDTGIGIAPSKHDTIFEPFSQADGSITRHFGGTGLGLSITRRLAGLMGGRVWVESEPGAGATFHFTADLPATAAPASTATAASLEAREADPPDADSAVAILLAEDSDVNVMVMKAMLDGTPHRIEAVPSGELALERFSGGRYGLVLMDIHMPGIDGYAATRALRDIERRTGRERTPVLALTASALDTDRAASLAAGCDEHLVKPIGRRQLLDAIEAFGKPEADVERRARQRAHAIVFLGSWQRSFDAAHEAGDAMQARALCEDLNSIARGIGEAALGEAGARLASALAGETPGSLHDAVARVARELRRVIVALTKGP